MNIVGIKSEYYINKDDKKRIYQDASQIFVIKSKYLTIYIELNIFFDMQFKFNPYVWIFKIEYKMLEG